MDNSDFDVDGLWNAIAEDLDKDAKPSTPVKSFQKLFKYLGLVLILFVFGGVGVMYLFRSNTSRDLMITPHNLYESGSAQTTKTKKREAGHLAKQKVLPRRPPASTDSSTKSLFSEKYISSINRPGIQSVIANTNAHRTVSNENRSSAVRKLKDETSGSPFPKSQNADIFVTDHSRPVAWDTIPDALQLISSLPSDPDKPKSPSTSGRPFRNEMQMQQPNRPTVPPHPPGAHLPPKAPESAGADNSSVEPQNRLSETADSSWSIAGYHNRRAADTDESLDQQPVGINQNNNPIDSLDQGQGAMLAINASTTRSLHWTVRPTAGTNKTLLYFNTRDDVAGLRNNHEKGSWGSFYGLNIGLAWKDRFVLSSGLEYHILWSRLDYTQQTTWIQDSVLQEVVLNLNGEVVGITYGSRTRSVTTQTIWNNRFQIYRVPLEIGYQHHLKHWILGAQMGAVFNFTISQKGKTFNQEKAIADFSRTDSFAPFKAFQIGWRLSPVVGYRLSGRTTLLLESKWTGYKGRTADVQELGFGLSLGVNFW